MRIAWLLSCLAAAAAAAQSPSPQSPTAPLAAARPGFVLYQGKWRLPQEVAYLQRAAATRMRAADPAVAGGGPGKHRALARGRQPASAAQSQGGRATIRAQHVELLGFDRVAVGVGNGQVRLMLPRTRSITIGTTVSLPFR